MNIKVMIADDHPIVLRGLRHTLEDRPGIELTGIYTNGDALMNGLAKAQADVLVLDIHMPGNMNGELPGKVHEKYPQIRILILTNEDNMYYIKDMLRKGVAGYILKTTDEETILDAVRTVYNGGQYIDSLLKEKVLQDALQAKKQLSSRPVLSDREAEVLKYLAQDLTSQQMAEKIFVSRRTIDYYRVCLFTKLGVKNVGALVTKGIQLGYIR